MESTPANDSEDIKEQDSKDAHSESRSSISNPNYCGPEEEESPCNKDCDSEMVVILCDTSHLCSCTGLLHLLHMILSLCCLLAMVTCHDVRFGDYLMLPFSWRFRVMVFAVTLTLLSSLCVFMLHTTGVSRMLPINWWLLTTYLLNLWDRYSDRQLASQWVQIACLSLDFSTNAVLTVMLLIATSLVANTYTSYKGTKMPVSVIQKLLICVVCGYICVIACGFSAFIGYRRWKIQLSLFKRRKLLEEEEFLEM